MGDNTGARLTEGLSEVGRRPEGGDDVRLSAALCHLLDIRSRQPTCRLEVKSRLSAPRPRRRPTVSGPLEVWVSLV